MNRTEEREALYTAYSEKVRGYVFGKVANRHDAEDLVSDVFLKAYEKYPTFDADRASVSTWLYTITRNTVIDYFRTHPFRAPIARAGSCRTICRTQPA